MSKFNQNIHPRKFNIDAELTKKKFVNLDIQNGHYSTFSKLPIVRSPYSSFKR